MTSSPVARPLLSSRSRRRLAPYLFISPFFLMFGLFFLYPLLKALWLSFFQQLGISGQPRFVGLDNYARLFEDPFFVKSVLNTTYYALGGIALIVPLALLLAYLLTLPKLRGREVFRLMFFTPYLTSAVVAAIVFGLVFSRDFGLLNTYLLAPLGIRPVAWLDQAEWIMPAVILLGVWKFTGLNTLYFMVGFQNISREHLEAATMDGANAWQTFRFVTLPLLRPVMVFVVTLAIIGSYRLFSEPFILLNATGGSENAGLFMTMYLYQVGFRDLNLGYASAIGYALALIIVVITMIQLVVMRSFRED